MLPKINVSLSCVTQDYVSEYYFFHPKDRIIKGISTEAIQQFLLPQKVLCCLLQLEFPVEYKSH